MRRLSELEPGQKGKIISFENDDLFLKLMEMGCVPGEIVEMDNIESSGDPISIKIAGYQLSLRKDEAATIFIEKI